MSEKPGTPVASDTSRTVDMERVVTTSKTSGWLRVRIIPRPAYLGSPPTDKGSG